MSTVPTPPALPHLCYARPGQIPHQPHLWYAPNWRSHHEASDPLVIGVWYCDGWAALLPQFTSQLAAV